MKKVTSCKLTILNLRDFSQNVSVMPGVDEANYKIDRKMDLLRLFLPRND